VLRGPWVIGVDSGNEDGAPEPSAAAGAGKRTEREVDLTLDQSVDIPLLSGRRVVGCNRAEARFTMSQTTVTLRVIAERLNVSKVTVSMALRDDPRVAKATKERVRQVATELGYTPNPRLGKLMAELARSRVAGDRTGELAFITSFDTEFAWRKSYHLNGCFEGAKRHAETLGYTLTPFWSLSRRFESGRLSELLLARGIEGVIIAPLGYRLLFSPEASLDFDWNRFCNVQIGATLAKPALHLARHNHFSGMTLCVESLEALGYRRIGLVLSEEGDLRSHHLWCSAYLSWRAWRKMETELPYFIFAGEIDRPKMAAWIEAHAIDAVVAMDTLPLQTLRDLKIDVPGEVGFATLDHNKQDMSICGIHQHAEAIGAAAVDQLVQSIRKGETGIPELPKQILVGGKWIQGTTTRRVREVVPSRPRLMDEPMRSEV
jgi:LacI family transcriptional regulator